jgi:PAS domain-containing protein
MNHDIILQHMSDGVVLTDAEWRIVSTNGRAETLLQKPGNRLIGATLWDSVPELGGSRAEQELRSVCESQFARRIEHFSPSRYMWFELHVVPTERECMIFMRDVTDRARQMQTEAVRALMRQILMDAPIAVSIVRGAELRYEMVNNRARQLIGGRDVEGKTIRNAFPELEGTGLIEVVEQVFESGKPVSNRNVSVKLQRGDGALKEGVFDVTYQPLFDTDGTVWGVMSVAVEVTDYYKGREATDPSADG